MTDPMLAPSMAGPRDFKCAHCHALPFRLRYNTSLARSWFLKSAAGALVGEAGVAAAYATYRKAYAQQALQVFFRNHFREEWLQKR
jgi:hypothetical protein